jgi:hypothetical protein
MLQVSQEEMKAQLDAEEQQKKQTDDLRLLWSKGGWPRSCADVLGSHLSRCLAFSTSSTTAGV